MSQVYISVYCTDTERHWVKHAATLKGISMAEYIKRAVNAQLRKEGVDAVLFRTRGDKE